MWVCMSDAAHMLVPWQETQWYETPSNLSCYSSWFQVQLNYFIINKDLFLHCCNIPQHCPWLLCNKKNCYYHYYYTMLLLHKGLQVSASLQVLVPAVVGSALVQSVILHFHISFLYCPPRCSFATLQWGENWTLIILRPWTVKLIWSVLDLVLLGLIRSSGHRLRDLLLRWERSPPRWFVRKLIPAGSCLVTPSGPGSCALQRQLRPQLIRCWKDVWCYKTQIPRSRHF